MSCILFVNSRRQLLPVGVNLLTGGEDGADDSASLGPSEGLQPDRVLRGGAQLSHAVRHGGGTQDHLLKEERR